MVELAEYYSVRVLVEGVMSHAHATQPDRLERVLRHGDIQYTMRAKAHTKFTGMYWFYELRVTNTHNNSLLFFANGTSAQSLLDQYARFAKDHNAVKGSETPTPRTMYDSIW